MNNTLNYSILINSNFEKVNGSFNMFQNNISTGITKIQKQLNSISLNAMIQNISSAADGLTSINEPGMKLSSSLADLTAITGVAGKGLKEIEGYARENAKTFGTSAADGVEAYKLILSQLTPEIAKQPKALQAMGNSVATLSKTMGGDTVAATEVLTTAMNQYQVSLDDPIRASKDMASMMNIMAASAKEGSAELPQIKAALEQAGMGAKMANVSFAETNAAIQILDKAGKKGSEGGTAFRNVLVKLSQGNYIPKEYKKSLKDLGVDVFALSNKHSTLADRLKALKPALKDGALLSSWLGEGADGATKALMAQIPELERLTGAVQNTNTAYKQAAIVMESPLEKNKRLQAQIDDFKISLFNGTNGWLAYANVIGDTAKDFSNLMPIFSGAIAVFTLLTNKTKLQALWTTITTGVTGAWTWAQSMLNAAMTANPIGLIIVAIAALVALIATAISYYDQWGAAILMIMGPIGWVVNGIMAIKDHWDSISQAFTTEGIIGGLKRIGIVLLDVLLKPVQQLLEMIAKIPGLEKIAGSGAKSIKDLRKSMDLITPGESAKALKREPGIKPPSLPGTDFGKGGATGLGGGAKGGDKMKKANESVATGGTKHNYYTINIKELNGLKDVIISAKDAATKAGNEVGDELLRVLAMAGTATG